MSGNRIVTVQYKDLKGNEFKGNEYSYFAETDLEVGQIVKVPTKYGDSVARVSKVGISEDTIPAMLRKVMRRITPECIVTDENGNPKFDEQQRLDI